MDGVRCAHLFLRSIDFPDHAMYACFVNNICGDNAMSKMTVSQMEVVLLDRIEKAKIKLDKLQQKHKIEIGALAYKHGLHQFDIKRLDTAFLKLAGELRHDNA